jgi:hypothetical protein
MDFKAAASLPQSKALRAFSCPVVDRKTTAIHARNDKPGVF